MSIFFLTDWMVQIKNYIKIVSCILSDVICFHWLGGSFKFMIGNDIFKM